MSSVTIVDDPVVAVADASARREAVAIASQLLYELVGSSHATCRIVFDEVSSEEWADMDGADIRPGVKREIMRDPDGAALIDIEYHRRAS